MSWYVFEDGRQNRPAPDFKLLTPLGDELNLMAFRNRSNLVMVFLHGEDCGDCDATARQLASAGEGFYDRDSRVALIYPAKGAPLPHSMRSQAPGVMLLADPAGRARETYAELVPGACNGQTLIVVLDRYSAPYAALVSNELNSPSLESQILEWLDYIEVQCPE